MKTRISISIYQSIIDLENYCNIDIIRDSLNSYVQKDVIPNVNIDDLDDKWSLLVIINFRSTNDIGVFKRVRRYPSDFEIEISISIPIPSDRDATYGVPEEKHAYHLDLNNNFHILEASYEDYDNLESYMIDSSKKALQLGFTKGFTCNGKKIKFQK